MAPYCVIETGTSSVNGQRGRMLLKIVLVKVSLHKGWRWGFEKVLVAWSEGVSRGQRSGWRKWILAAKIHTGSSLNF